MAHEIAGLTPLTPAGPLNAGDQSRNRSTYHPPVLIVVGLVPFLLQELAPTRLGWLVRAMAHLTASCMVRKHSEQ